MIIQARIPEPFRDREEVSLLQPVDLPVLCLQISQVRFRIDLGAGHPLDEFLRIEFISVAVDLFPQPS
jgi:hypothetical protein